MTQPTVIAHRTFALSHHDRLECSLIRRHHREEATMLKRQSRIAMLLLISSALACGVPVTDEDSKTAAALTAQATTFNKPLFYYQQIADNIIGYSPSEDILVRNQRITAAYARLFTLNPRQYSWFGAAMHASWSVGFAMSLMRCWLDGNCPPQVTGSPADLFLKALQASPISTRATTTAGASINAAVPTAATSTRTAPTAATAARAPATPAMAPIAAARFSITRTNTTARSHLHSRRVISTPATTARGRCSNDVRRGNASSTRMAPTTARSRASARCAAVTTRAAPPVIGAASKANAAAAAATAASAETAGLDHQFGHGHSPSNSLLKSWNNSDHFKSSVPLMTEELPGLKGVSIGQEPDEKIVAAFQAKKIIRGSFGKLRCGALTDALKSLLQEAGAGALLQYDQFRERSDSNLRRDRIDPANPAQNLK
jgi:hypothetical protein